MTRAFTDIAQLVGQVVPPWLLGPLAVLLLLAALPLWLRSVRIKQIGGRTRRLIRAEGAERDALVQEIFDLTGDKPALLLAAVEHATRYGQRDVRDRAAAGLRAQGAKLQDLELLLAKEKPEPKPIPHPIEVAVNVERMLSEGMVETARERLEQARTRYPDDPDLDALWQRVQEARDQASANG